MNSIHDYGGMDGFTLPERDQGPILKEEWERELWGLVIAVWSKEIAGYGGGSRVDLEEIPPELYIDMPYYAKWLHGAEISLVRSGLATREELDNPEGPMSMPELSGFVPARPADVTTFLTSDDSNELPAEVPPRFAVGDEVIVKNNHPAGHTRVPRYTRGHRGVIQNHHGVHRFQDHVADGEDPGQQHLYTVMFNGTELWGSRGNANDRIGADLWEIHLEPAA